MSKPSRREFLGGALLAGLAGTAFARKAASAVMPGLAASIVECLADREAAARLGARYTANLPARPVASELCRAILKTPEAERDFLLAEPAIRRARIADAIRDDYRASRTVDFDGWVLSVTEVSLFALAAIHAAG